MEANESPEADELFGCPYSGLGYNQQMFTGEDGAGEKSKAGYINEAIGMMANTGSSLERFTTLS